ncbi:flippase [Halorussus salinus]|uniref:flippase n=1 Tax=Halorussus salinus TaxID=1364935 RepID=UPI001092281D|nr:flippase [Halorussus salinus]
MTDDESSLSIVAKQGSITLVGDVVGRGLGFLFVVLVTRLASPSVYGTFTLSLSIVMFVQGLASLNLHRAIDYFVPQHLDDGEVGQAKAVIVHVTRFAGSSSLVFTVLLFVSSGDVGRIFDDPSLEHSLPILALLVPIQTGKNVLLATFNSVKRMELRVLVKNFADPLVRVSVVGVLLSVGTGIVGLVTGYLLGTLFAVGAGVLLFRRYVNDIWTAQTRETSRWKLLSYSFPLMFAGLIYSIVGQVDYFIIGYLLDSSDVGYYRVAFFLSINLLIVLKAVTPVFKPLVAENKDNDSVLSKQYTVATRWITMLTLPVAITFTVAPTTYLALFFTPEYATAGLVVVALSMGYFINSMLGPEGMMLEGLGYTRLTLLNTIILITLNTVLDVLLVPELGILGAGIGTATALTVTSVLGVLELNYLRGLHPYSWDFLRVLGAGVPVLAFGELFARTITQTTIAATTLPIVVVAVYVASLRILGAFTERDARIARRIDTKVGYPVVETILFGVDGFSKL